MEADKPISAPSGYSGSGSVGVIRKSKFAVIAPAQLPAREPPLPWNDSSVRIIWQLYSAGCRLIWPGDSLSNSPKIFTVLLG